MGKQYIKQEIASPLHHQQSKFAAKLCEKQLIDTRWTKERGIGRIVVIKSLNCNREKEGLIGRTVIQLNPCCNNLSLCLVNEFDIILRG